MIASMLSIPTGTRYPPLNLSPAQQRRQTLSALLDQMEGLAKKQPVLMVFEDAHWADATSLELLDLAVERVRRLPVLLLITFRPEFEAPWKGLLDVETMTLGRLDRAEAERLVERVTGGRKLPAEVLAQIVAKTDGVPLFVEELTKNVLESGLLIEEADRYRLDGPLPPLAIPSTLQDSLMARLDRLATVKEIAQIGAAIGREFSYPLLNAVVGRDEATLRAALTQLEDSGLVFRAGEAPAARYTFKRLPKSMHASVRRVLRQAWEMDDAERAETLIRNLARRLERDWNGVSASILEGIDEMLTVTRLGLPRELRRSLACTNIIENVMGTVRRVCRNVKYWRSPSMALRWAAAAMQEAVKGFRRLKAYKHLPALRAALAKQGQQSPSDEALAQIAEAA